MPTRVKAAFQSIFETSVEPYEARGASAPHYDDEFPWNNFVQRVSGPELAS